MDSPFHNWRWSMFENLEVRRLLSFSIVDHKLIVNGTDGQDIIVFRDQGWGRFVLSINGKDSRSFGVLRLKRIVVNGRDGDDYISLENAIYQDARIILRGNRGDDTLRGSGLGDSLLGGLGRDE